MSEVVSIDDPRHPSQMDCSAAERHVSKWRGILAAVSSRKATKAWAQAKLSFMETRLQDCKRRIAAEKGAV